MAYETNKGQSDAFKVFLAKCVDAVLTVADKGWGSLMILNGKCWEHIDLIKCPQLGDFNTNNPTCVVYREDARKKFGHSLNAAVRKLWYPEVSTPIPILMNIDQQDPLSHKLLTNKITQIIQYYGKSKFLQGKNYESMTCQEVLDLEREGLPFTFLLFCLCF